MPAPVYILFGAAFTVAVSTALGKLLLRRLNVSLCREEEHLLGFVTGGALLSTLVFLLCAAGAARKGVFLWLGIAILALAWRRGIHRAAGGTLPPLKNPWQKLFQAVFWTYVVLYVVNAMAPEASSDGSTYHLGLAARYLREHGFPRITTNMYANLSQGAEMLFLYAFAFGRHSAAALVHCAYVTALPLLMVCWGRRFGMPLAGVCGAILVFVSPVVGIDGVSAYIDVAVACIAFALFYLLQIWDTQRRQSLLVPIGLLAGFGYAAKYTAFVGVPYALGFIAWRAFSEPRPRNGPYPASGSGRKLLRRLTLVAACAILMMLPWMAKNWIILGNPFSPFLNAVFPNPYIQVGFERDYAHGLRQYDGLKSYSQLPLMVTTTGEFAGLIGPFFLLAPVALFGLRTRIGRQLLLAAFVFGIPYFANTGTRFLIPALPFLSLAMALVLAGVPWLAPALAVIHALLSFPLVVATYARPTAWRLDKLPVFYALRIRPEDDYLTARLANYAIARELERLVPPAGKVFAFGQVPEAYTKTSVVVGYESAYGNVLRDILFSGMLPDYMPRWLLRFHFAPREMRRVRVVETAAAPLCQWSVTEMRLFLRQKELPRAPEWRLRAKPNPWEVQLAFDNNPVTRWRTWLPIEPGMFVDVDLGKPRPMDGVLLECSRDQFDVRLKLEGQDAGGTWRTVAEAPEIIDAPPIAGLRHAAILELKARGFTHLLVYDSDFGADDFRLGSKIWGITLISQRGDARVYKLD